MAENGESSDEGDAELAAWSLLGPVEQARAWEEFRPGTFEQIFEMAKRETEFRRQREMALERHAWRLAFVRTLVIFALISIFLAVGIWFVLSHQFIAGSVLIAADLLLAAAGYFFASFRRAGKSAATVSFEDAEPLPVGLNKMGINLLRQHETLQVWLAENSARLT